MTSLLLALFLAGLGLWRGQALAKTYLTQQQALHEVFPDAQVGRKTLFLSPEQVKSIEALARAKVESRIISYYVARGSGGMAGIAFFDRQLVRTMPMTYCVVVRPSGELDRVEILSFEEPDDYLPPPRWLSLYRSRRLNDELAIGKAIPHITGASLTSQAVNDGVRRALATFSVAIKETL